MNQPIRPYRIHNLTGKTFGRLTVTTYERKPDDRRTYWRCRCACGKESVVWAANLINGHTKSCGCLLPDTVSTHRRSRTSEYGIWHSMIQRCRNPNNDGYKNYGGRGIAVCDRWGGSFEDFLADVGPRPSPAHTIDRIDNNGHYEPGNVRWATRKRQLRNTRKNRLVTFQGRTLCAIEWSEITGIPKGTLVTRLARGWPPERALTTPIQKPGR